MGESSPTRLRSTLATGQSVVQRAVMEHLARRYQGAAKKAHAEEEKGVRWQWAGRGWSCADSGPPTPTEGDVEIFVR